MLKKIENIASPTEFKNNTRFAPGVYSLPNISGGISNSSDSLSFSSAFRYLSQLKWQLKSFEQTEADVFNIEFLVDNLFFVTKVSINNSKSTDINYKISDQKITGLSDHKYQTIISFDFDPEVYSQPAFASSVEYIKKLFEKFALYDSILLKSSNNPEVNSFFIDGDEKKLRLELSLIHRNIIFFVEKVTGEVLSNNLRTKPFSDDYEKLIKILNINVKL